METIEVQLGERSYPIWVGHGVLSKVGAMLGNVLEGKSVGLVTDDNVAKHHLEPVVKSLSDAGFSVVVKTIEGGEQRKTLATVEDILGTMLQARLDRTSAIVALGGGVVGDIAGFAAAVLLRGVDIVQIPTTIVSQADSSVGGKTGVNHAVGKNLIGVFHQPRAVIVDTDTLKTLPKSEVKAGLAEVIKHGIIRDARFFERLERDLPKLVDGTVSPEELVSIMAHNCRIKADVVSRDETEQGLRAILNYGHTVGHAIEALTGYTRYRHGEAVLFGMLVAGRLGVEVGSWSSSDEARQNALIEKVLNVEPPNDLNAVEVADKTMSDKKVRQGKLRFVLPRRIGHVEVVDSVTTQDIERAWKSVFG